jgi:GT2 family glycosyltransferase
VHVIKNFLGELTIKTSSIVVPVYGNFDLAKKCLLSISESDFISDTPILVWNDGSSESEFNTFKEDTVSLNLNIKFSGTPKNFGFVQSVNSALKLINSDVALVLNSDIEVFGNWQQEIVKSFEAYPRVATVSTLTNAGSILSTPLRNANIPELPTAVMRETYAELVSLVSKHRTPLIVTPVGHLFAVSMDVWRQVGGFSDDFSPGYGEEVDFGERAIALGYANVLADSVWVSHKNGSSFGNSDEVKKMRSEHDQLIHKEHPTFLHRAFLEATSEDTTLSACLSDINKYLLSGQGISSNKFFQSEEYLTLQEYLKNIYFPDHDSYELDISRELEMSTNGYYFNDNSKILFILNVENLYNPYSNISNDLFREKLNQFNSNIGRTEFIVLKSELEIQLLLGMKDLGDSKIFLVPKSDKSDRVTTSNGVTTAGLRTEILGKSMRIEFYKPCAKECEATFCPPIVSKIILEKSKRVDLHPSTELLRSTDYFGPRLSKIRRLVVGKRIEKLLIPVSSRRRNSLKRLIHKIVAIYQSGKLK